MRIVVLVLSMFIVLVSANAQGGWSVDNINENKATVALEEVVKGSYLGSIDHESRILFIDFETYLYNIKGIQITDVKGEVVYSQDTQDLPVNAILDFDFEKKPKGYYTIWVDTYIGVTNQIVKI